LKRESVFITNLIKYRPIAKTGGNRSPSSAETRRALPYLLDEIGILSPSLVVCLGLSSAKPLLRNPGLKMSDANGLIYDRHGLKMLVTYHPSPFNYRIPRKREAITQAFRRLREMEPRTLQNGT
jgi:DNA polymerase